MWDEDTILRNLYAWSDGEKDTILRNGAVSEVTYSTHDNAVWTLTLQLEGTNKANILEANQGKKKMKSTRAFLDSFLYFVWCLAIGGRFQHCAITISHSLLPL
jgi:hypothetical protein